MAETARAAVFFGPGKPFEIKSVPIPAVEPEGVLIRVTGDTIALSPPLIIERSHVDQLFGRLDEVLSELP